MSLLKALASATRKPSAISHQLRAAREFLRAFPASEYRIQIVNRVDKKQSRDIEPVTGSQLLEHVSNGTLARANANSACIFARPIRRDLLLIDDLPPHAIQALINEGFAPAAVIQSSAQKTNAILRIPSINHGDRDLHALTQRLIIEHLIERGFSADRAAARDLQVWRLPGFSNQKRNDDGSQKYLPTFFAKFLSINPDIVAQRGEEFAQRARAIIELGGDDSEVAPKVLRKTAASGESTAEADERVIYAPGKYLTKIFDGVRGAGVGGRNQALYDAAFTLFQLAAGAIGDTSASRIFDADFFERALTDASSSAGLEAGEIESTIASARKAAATKPVRPILVGFT